MKLPTSQILVAKPSNYWVNMGERRALQLFKSASERVPAYRKFLKEHGVDASQIRTKKDLARVPYISKENYLRKYPLHELVWDGEIDHASMISRSSGSSGKPFYWLSNQQQRNEVGDYYDLVFSLMFDMQRKNTLVIIAYGMGSWVAGTTTLLSSIEFMNRHKCTVITPGFNKKEVIEICQDIGHEYDQVVICAYPPFVKEIVDFGLQEGVNWSKLHPKFIFGAEAFTEEFRDYILSQVGSKSLLDTVNTIGSADAMVIGHETPLSIALRRLIHADDTLQNEVLGAGRMPTLAQYYPWQKYLECVDNELLITSNGAIPLIRYNIHDHAKLYTYNELAKIIQARGHENLGAALPRRLAAEFDWKLPFLLLYGKSSNAVSIYGALLYPENVKTALERADLARFFTGKFKMEVYFDNKQNQRFRLHIELAPGIEVKQIETKELRNDIVKTVCKLNSEIKAMWLGTGKKTMPQIKLHPYGKFEVGPQIKHRYVA